MGDTPDTSENLSRQLEELEALKSIYGDEWHVDTTTSPSYSISLTEGDLQLELFITLPEGYPGQSPPLFQILAPALSRSEMQEITLILQNVYLENLGETVIFQWVEKAREWLQDQVANVRDSKSVETEHEHTSLTGEEKKEDENLSAAWKLTDGHSHAGKTEYHSECPRIVHGDPICSKKSTFQGHVATVVCADQVKQVIAELMGNKKIAHATHNMYAYRIFLENSNSFIQDCDDDGEAQAGGRLLHLLQIMDVQNVVVVVSRWYGGVHLGPDRFRLINNAARQVVEKAGLIPAPDQKKKK